MEKLKLTYMLSPTASYMNHTLASNVVSENLIADQEIDVIFNHNIIYNMLHIKELRKKIVGDSIVDKYLQLSPNTSYLLSVVHASQEFFESVLKTIKTDLVLVTCYNAYSIPFIKFLLENGKRVVIGGALCTAYSCSQIRKMIEIDTKNLMIVKGFVDLTTDLSTVIREWRDFEIKHNDFSTVWDATQDHIKGHINMARKFKGNKNPYGDFYYLIMFSNSCWYKKCTFCNIEDQQKANMIKGVDKDKIVESLLLNLKQYKTKNLYIGDPFFTFNDDKRYILGKLKKEGIHTAVATGIQLLMNKDYIDDVNRYLSEIRVGLESCSDFSLSYINKGYGWKEIQYAMNNIINHLSLSISHRWLYISDLADRNRKSVMENYKRLNRLKTTFMNADFRFEWIPRHLIIFPGSEVSKNTQYIRITENGPNVSGMWAIYNHMKKYFDINMSESLVLPYERYDESGNILPSDCELVSLPPQ